MNHPQAPTAANDSARETTRALIELMKPRIVTLVLVTAALGYYLGAKGNTDLMLLSWFLIGTTLTCGGSGVLNHYLERDIDLKMHRTRTRPLPRGVIDPSDALAFGISLVLVGTALLVWKVNLLSGFLALLTAFLYVLVYTPLKRITWLNTFVGAIPGALPPLGGWVAATNTLSFEGWVLFAILFLWQHPHFYAIAWMYREDYARGGLKMLPVVEPDGRSTFRQIITYSYLLIPISLIPAAIGLSGKLYLVGAFLLGVYMLIGGLKFARSRTDIDARMLLRRSVIYLPLLLLLIVIDHIAGI